ncbi:ABC transporter, partial [Pseudoalteromonas sp. S4389]
MSEKTIALNIEGLNRVYKNGVEAVKGIDLQVQQGDLCAVLGHIGGG